MTRIIIFGDLHANWEALLALQQAEPQPEVVLCLGDIVGYGPDPKRCLDAVRTSATHLIGGWHDRAVGGSQISHREDDLLEATWAHTRSMLSAADRDYLASLPEQLIVEIAGTRFCLTRFSPDDIEAETHMLITMSQARLREYFGEIEADVILLGGPHVPALRQIDDRLIVCPGSLGSLVTAWPTLPLPPGRTVRPVLARPALDVCKFITCTTIQRPRSASSPSCR